MILNQYGKPVQRSSVAPSDAIIKALNASMLETIKQSMAFCDEFVGRIVDHHGDPVYSKLPKIGSTIQVRKPIRIAPDNSINQRRETRETQCPTIPTTPPS